jgi:hypothetical protein
MRKTFNRDVLPDALDQIGSAAVAAGTKPHIDVYGGSALTLARKFPLRDPKMSISPKLGSPGRSGFRISLNASC